MATEKLGKNRQSFENTNLKNILENTVCDGHRSEKWGFITLESFMCRPAPACWCPDRSSVASIVSQRCPDESPVSLSLSRSLSLSSWHKWSLFAVPVRKHDSRLHRPPG
jgi:hypothetical protein